MHCSLRFIVQILVFSRSYLHRQVSPPETVVVKGGTTWARNGQWILPENARHPRNIKGSFALNLQHGTNIFTSLPKEGVLRIFSSWRPADFGTKGQHATARPPKQLLHCVTEVLILWFWQRRFLRWFIHNMCTAEHYIRVHTYMHPHWTALQPLCSWYGHWPAFSDGD